MSEVFYCYSPSLKCELLNIGERYIAKTVHPETKRSCWLFLRNNTLLSYLDNRKKNNNRINAYTKNPKFID